MRGILIALFMLPVFVYGQNYSKSISIAQKWDTILSNPVYVSFHSQTFGSPVAVVYKLYRGGGPCSRAGFNFINDLNIITAKSDDYLRSGYDKGHMANSEDFANNCIYDEMTFRFYNCVPQKPELNRGPWKTLEEKIRARSQVDSLLIFCVNVYGDTSLHLGRSAKALAPTICIKGAKDMKTGAWIYLEKFTNTANPEQTHIEDPSEIGRSYGINLKLLEKLFRKNRKS